MKPVVAVFVLSSLIGGPLASQAPDRSSPPKPGPPPAVRPPAIQKRTLTNGLPVWIVELHKVPTAHAALVIKAGGGADPASKFGIASLTAEMLDEGAGTRGALEIADAVDHLGADLSTSSSFDSSSINLHVPAARLPDALPVMADVALRPTFPMQELQRVRDEVLTTLVEARDDPARLAGIAFARLVYGPAHRYGTIQIGTAAALKSFTLDDLRQFHAAHYGPSNAALLVAGDVTPDRLLPLLESAFGAWKGAARAAPALPSAPQVQTRQVFLIDRPDAPQSQVRIAGIGVPRSTPDYFAVRVLNTVLGGAFTSRLNTNLREEHGYSYGASSVFEMRSSAGPFVAAAGVQTDKTADALREFFKELNGIHKPVPPDELEKAKNYLSLLLPHNFETTTSVAASLAQLFVYDLPENYYTTYIDRVRAVTAADVQRAAERYIQPDKLAVIIVGDRKTIEAPVRALNLGPIRIVTTDEIMR